MAVTEAERIGETPAIAERVPISGDMWPPAGAPKGLATTVRRFAVEWDFITAADGSAACAEMEDPGRRMALTERCIAPGPSWGDLAPGPGRPVRVGVSES
mmetsp:Transcript_28683/g.85302  ORF Transcript_28683/g.85302 Transcript_28683/m.85302 type:complete len:100 (-) Transcript_28683:245-544(-)